jgi:hypothetical protein
MNRCRAANAAVDGRGTSNDVYGGAGGWTRIGDLRRQDLTMEKKAVDPPN